MAEHRERDALRMFAHLDTFGVEGITATAELELHNGDILTVKAGGPGIRAWPSAAPFETFEVLLDHEPARFWSKYTDSAGVLYAYVPKLLLAHHILRRGGIKEMLLDCQVRKAVSAMSIQITLPLGAETSVLQAIAALDGVSLVSSHQNREKYLHTGV